MTDQEGGVPAQRGISSLLPFLVILIAGVFFSVYPSAQDPFWKPKELAFMAGTMIWLSLRPILFRRSLTRNFCKLFIPLVIFIFAQTLFLHVFPLLTSSGNRILNPWVTPVLIQLILGWLLFQDMESLEKNDYLVLWKAISLSGLALAILMILQKFNCDPFTFFLENRYGKVTWLHENHMIGLMGNSFQASACLSMIVPVSAVIGWWPVSFTLLIAILLAGSASAILSAVGGLFAVMFLKGWRKLTALSIGLFSLFLFFSDKSFSSFSGRIYIWTESIKIWMNKFFLFGSGIGTYKLLGISLPNPMEGRPPTSVRWAHNEYIQLGIEIGVIGLILLLIPLLILIIRSLKSGHGLLAPIGAMLSGLILSVSHFPLHMAPTALILLIALSHLSHNQLEKEGFTGAISY